jgi:dienelactone hydrolase
MSMRLITGFLVLLALCTAAGEAAPHKPQIKSDRVQVVTFPSHDHAATHITGYFVPAEGDPPWPAVVAMHGCGGLFKEKSGKPSKKMIDWAKRLNKAGFAVLFPDSFGSRGLGSICTLKPRPLKERDRARDAEGAAAWLAARPDINPGKIALLGWSNGGTTVLWSLDPERTEKRVPWLTAIAFYPWCKDILQTTHWKPHTPLTILIGGADDWTPPEPCEKLAKEWDARITVFPGAYHSFDHPGEKVEMRKGLAVSEGDKGFAMAGTDPKARHDAIDEVMSLLSQACVR